MLKIRPFKHGLPKFLNKCKLSFKVALAISILVFLSGYQPFFGSPPLNHSIARAQNTQEQTITPDALPFTFKLPHPGYVSTRFSPFHPGVDIAAGLGMPIHPVTDGIIQEAGYNPWGLGLTVNIDHGQGFKSLYAHLGKIYVKAGQKVNINDTLGEVGLTGHTSGPHTHLEISRNAENINPLPLLPTLEDISKAWGPNQSPRPKVAPRVD